MSFLSRAGVAATRSTRVVQKRFGSHAAHHGPEAPPTQEGSRIADVKPLELSSLTAFVDLQIGFTSNGFKIALIGVVSLMAWSRIDEHLTKQGEEKHPFTRYIEYYMRSEQESNRLNEQHIQLAQAIAEDKKFVNGATRPPKIQLRYPELIEVGTAVDTENIAHKFH
ncbi:hypothetical protein BGZ58_008449 [Dissophora ornata]|nr:hypothetical protein BGZ58_008449 [Dissophora ornata]